MERWMGAAPLLTSNVPRRMATAIDHTLWLCEARCERCQYPNRKREAVARITSIVAQVTGSMSSCLDLGANGIEVNPMMVLNNVSTSENRGAGRAYEAPQCAGMEHRPESARLIAQIGGSKRCSLVLYHATRDWQVT